MPELSSRLIGASRTLRALIAALAFVLLAAASASAQLLVVAPHPDDDVLTAAGVISRALSRGQTVRVVYMTNGDYQGVNVGLLRQAEAVAAEALLGVPENQLIFLGYPDAGLQTIRTGYPNAGSSYVSLAGVTATYGNRGLGGTDYHTYRFGSPGSYNWATIIDDLADIIGTFQPTQIVTLSVADRHSDHSNTSYAVTEATARAITTSPGYNPTIHRTIVWGPDDPWPAPPDPTVYFPEIVGLTAGTGLVWANRESLDVPLSMQVVTLINNLKWKALNEHHTQGSLTDLPGTSGFHLASFIHKEEFFWTDQLVAGTAAPVPNAGLDQTKTGGQLVTLSATASWDPLGQPLTYTWTQASGPSVTLSSLTAASPTFTAPTVASATKLTFEVVVSNGALTSLPDAVSVLVSTPGGSNVAPVANAGPDQTIAGGNTAMLDGSASTDTNGDPLTYVWTQVGGPAVTLIGPTSVRPMFLATASAQAQVLTFSLIVSDGLLASTADSMTVTIVGMENIAPLATVTASSEGTTWGQLAIKAVDGVVDGFPGDYQREWVTNGEGPGAWIQLAFASTYAVNHVRLHDRVNTNDQLLSGTLSFSDGSTVAVGALTNDGTGVDVNFSTRNITWVKFTVNSVSGSTANAGLAEFVLSVASGPPPAPAVTLSPASLTFASQTIGTTSAGQVVTLTNSGTSALNIGTISMIGTNSGDFAKTTTCGSSLAAGANCTFTITFTPTAAGNRVATLNITDNASGNPHTVSLTGTGAGTPAVTLAPASLTFASQTVGTTSTGQVVTVTNSGTGSLTISSLGLGGANSADFSHSTTCGATLAAGANCTVTVTFTPTAPGARAATLAVTDNAAGSPHTATLGGTGAGLPAVTLAPASLTFANQPVGTTSAGQVVTLTNTGTASLTISSTGITGTHSGDFARTTTCGATLAAGANCTVTVTFTPTATGARVASLSISDDATGSPHTVSLTGTGTAPAVTLAPASLTFANQPVGTTSAGQVVTLTNTGTASLTISSTGITGTHSGDFARTTTCGATLAAGANCTLTVTFTPTATGARGASLSITDDATGSPHTVSLTGTGTTPAVTLAPASLTFASQTVGTTSAGQVVTLTNTGTASLTISSTGITGTHSGDFARTTTCGATLAAGANCTLTVTFTPTATGARVASLTITDDATGSPHTVSLTGTGTTPAVTLAPASLTFASQTVGTTSAGQVVTLTNTGTASLTISSTGITGTHSGDFARTTTCGATLAAGANCTLTVTFTPTATGARVASLTITDNATGSPHTVSLSGTGTAVPTPAVTLAPASLTFAGQTVGTTSAGQVVTLTNTGTASLTISSTGITGTHSGDFARTTTCGATLAAGANCTLTVTFTPTATGARVASLTITDDATGSPHTVSLSGTGAAAPAPAVTLAPASLTFASQTVGTTSGGQVVTFTNTGTASLTISSTSITGTHSGDFARTTTCGATLAAGANCTLTVTFTPTATGARVASLSITDNATGSPHTVSLTGTGALAAATNIAPLATVTASSEAPAYGQLAIKAVDDVADGYPGDYTKEWATNGERAGAWIQLTFGSAYAIDQIRLHDRPNTNDRVMTGTLSFSDGTTVAVGALTNNGTGVNISFAARTITWVRFTVNSVSAATQNVGLAEFLVFTSGLPAQSPAVTLSPTSLTFASQTVGTTSGGQVVTLSNTGTGSLTISGISVTGTNSSDFGQTSTCGATVAAGANCTITVTFTPTAEGARAATLTITDDATGSPHTVSLTGTGAAPAVPAATLAPTSLTFASQTTGTTSAGQVVTLTNTGTASLTISSTGITGTDSGDFARTTTCGATLAAGANCTLTVTFTPTATGSRVATLSVTDDATGSPHTVSLTGTGAAPAVPAATLAPTSLTFASQTTGTTSAGQVVTLTNTGTASLTISSTGITGTDSGDFARTTTCGATLAAGANCTLTVTFTPTATGSRVATLSVTDDAAGSPHTVSLTGTGAAPAVPAATLAPTSLTFASQPVGTTSTGQVVTLTNTGTASLTISGTGITGTHSGDFARTTTCGATLAAGANCTLTVTFTPTATGARVASLSITDDAAGSPHTVSLTGTGTTPAVTLAPTSLTFASQPVGTTSTGQVVTLTNTGTASLTISGTGITGTDSGDFARTTTCGATLAAGANCTLTVTFTPTATGARVASLSITDNAAGSPHTVSLTGTGTAPAVTLAPTSLTFASQTVGTTSAGQVVTLTNTGTASLTISSTGITGTHSGDFARTTTCGATLAAGANCTLTVTFTPTATGARVASLSITDNATGSPHTVSLSGTGAAAPTPAVTLAPASLTFASQTVGTTSAGQVVTLTNTGTASLTISSTSITGTHSGDFARTTTCGATLAAGANCTLTVTFTPTATGARGASLSITDNATGSPHTVSLSGTGAPAAATNIASLATVTASSEAPAYGQLAIKAVDGVADGFPGDYTKEWATNGQRAGAWIQLTFGSAYTIDQIRLHDRPNTNDRVMTGTLSFSDGTTVAVGALTNNGTGVDITFAARTITWVRFTVNSVSAATQNIGLSEMLVFTSGAPEPSPAPAAGEEPGSTVEAGSSASPEYAEGREFGPEPADRPTAAATRR